MVCVPAPSLKEAEALVREAEMLVAETQCDLALRLVVRNDRDNALEEPRVGRADQERSLPAA